MNQDSIDDMKQLLSGKLYLNLNDLHRYIETQSDSDIATDVIIAALAVNLGHMIGQLPSGLRKKTLRTVRQTIDEQISQAVKMGDIQGYGQIGHA